MRCPPQGAQCGEAGAESVTPWCGSVAAIAEAEATLKESGRLLIRPSGTEPVIRVMVEAEQQEKIDEVMAFVCSAIEAETGHASRPS